MPQTSIGEPTTTQQAVKLGRSGSVSYQPYIYKHSGGTKDSGYGAFVEALMSAASLGHATDSHSHTLWSSIKRKPNTASETKTSLPFKQLWGSDGESLAGIHAIAFEEVDNDDNQSHWNDNKINIIILGQDPNITMDAGLEPEQVSKAHQYQWYNDSPWVKEARNALLSQDPQALSDVRKDCTAIVVVILEEAKIQESPK